MLLENEAFSLLVTIIMAWHTDGYPMVELKNCDRKVLDKIVIDANKGVHSGKRSSGLEKATLGRGVRDSGARDSTTLINLQRPE